MNDIDNASFDEGTRRGERQANLDCLRQQAALPRQLENKKEQMLLDGFITLDLKRVYLTSLAIKRSFDPAAEREAEGGRVRKTRDPN